jgi:hypothetical protein
MILFLAVVVRYPPPPELVTTSICLEDLHLGAFKTLGVVIV